MVKLKLIPGSRRKVLDTGLYGSYIRMRQINKRSTWIIDPAPLFVGRSMINHASDVNGSLGQLIYETQTRSNSSLTLLLAGAKGFSCGGRLQKTPLLGSRKLRYLGTNGKRHLIDRDEISNFYKDHFQVRSIFRSPEVTKRHILRKLPFFRKQSLLSPKL